MNKCINKYDPSDERFWEEFDPEYRQHRKNYHEASKQGAKAGVNTPGNSISGDIPTGPGEVITNGIVDTVTGPSVDSAFGGK